MAKIHNSAPKFYLYYKKETGEILSVTNEINPNYKHKLDLEFDEIEKFISGEWKFSDYLVAYKRLADDETSLAVMPKVDDEYAFRNNVYEWIEQTDKKVDLTLEWNEPLQAWRFSLSKTARESYAAGILSSRLAFFVTLEADFDFLINTILIDVDTLLAQEFVVVPFSSSFEKKIEQLSIGSKLVFKTYGLKVTRE